MLDQLLGKTIADRYEVVSLIKEGGMGAVYRATQRALDREVAIKFIQPRLVAREAAERFMTEARASSRMNHPHVVSVFDFGRTAGPEGELLFLVMELVLGMDLGDVMGRPEPLPIPRVINIVGQILQGLGEAHHAGIVHRDMKPENVILTVTRSGGDHIKVIDFGLASMASVARITQIGIACGTPEYIAPEQANGHAPGPAADIYSTGALLFEMLTGEPPFVRPTPATTMYAHMTAERPDPRLVAPGRGIPDGVAEACMRALAIRPEDRFESAAAFEEALRASALTPSLAPRAAGQASSVPPPAPRSLLLLGRDADIEWVNEQWLAQRPWIALSGPSGVGRTRMLGSIAELARLDDALVVEVAVEPRPYDEIGYRGLRRIIHSLTGLSIAELLNGKGPSDSRASELLRMLFSKGSGQRKDAAAIRKAAAACLAWAARRALTRANGARVAVLIDDIDRLDVASLNALRDQQRDEPLPGFTVVSTGERAPAVGTPEIATRPLLGLTRAEARQMLRDANRADVVLTRGDDDIEPLYVEGLCHTRSSETLAIPARLCTLIESRIQALDAPERRVLQAVAVVGIARVDALPRLLRQATEVTSAESRELSLSEVATVLRSLLERGLLSNREGAISVSHELVARTAIGRAPGGVIAEIHAAAADGMEKTQEWLELRAHHAIRGRADFEAFLTVEDAARMRAQRGDDAGAIAMLWQALSAARMKIIRGEGGAAVAALGVFGRKLATALLSDGRSDEAQGILNEILDVAEPNDIGRALVLEQLAAIADVRNQTGQAIAHRREALAIAERGGDANTAERLRAFLAASGAKPPISRRGSPVPSRVRRSVLVVEDDREIRDGLKSAIESDGREAFSAGNGKEALEVLRRIPAPGLILLDLMMPVMTGWELLAQLRSEDAFARIPVVVVSAVSKREEPGAARVVQKPVDVKTLLSLVAEFCG